MRIIDVACGASFAITSMLILVAVNPVSMRQQTQTLLANDAAENLIQNYLGQHGLNFLAGSDFASICASVRSFGNQSAHLQVVLDGAACPGLDPPTAYTGSSKTTFELKGRMVTIEAWIQEGKR